MNTRREVRAVYPFACITIVICLFLSSPASQVARAQSSASATITGRVVDPAGASVGGAEVVATNTETGITRTTATASDGLFRLENLAPGFYDVLITATGFNKAQAKGVKLLVGDVRDANFSLTVSGGQVSVIVTTELPLIEATKTDTSVVIDDQAVADLPTTTSFNGIGGVANDYQGLAATAPGVRFDYAGNSSDIVGPGSVSDRGVLVNIDGGNISDQVVSSRDALGASVEEVKEFQVLTNNYNAEYGQAGNIILNVITKSGTNQVHGDFHAYFRGRNLGASTFFYNQTACDPTLGTGPGSCDTPSDAGFPADRAPFFKHEYGFTAGGPFVKDRFFWFGSLEKVHQGAPTTTTPFGVSQTVTQPTAELLWSGKVDAIITPKHTFTARYNVQRDLQSNLIVQTGGNTDPSGFVSSVVHDLGLNVAMISTPTNHTVNEARFFWHRFLSQLPPVSTAPGQGLLNAYVGADFCCPQGGLQNRYQYIDNLSWIHGAHTVKVGANISHFPYNSLFQQYHYGEYLSFTSNFTCQPYGQCPTQFTTGAGPGFVQATDNIYGFYIQDGWQILHNVTLNYGLRYDIENGAFKGGTILDNTVPGGCLQANGLIPACGSDKNNFQPRVGVAWSPDFTGGILHTIFGAPGKSVVRAAAAEVTMLAYLNVSLDSLNFDGKNLLTANIAAPASSCFLANGAVNPTPPAADAQACAVLSQYPNHPTPASLAPYVSGVISNFGRVRPIGTNIKNPEVRMASFSITRQIGPSFVFSVGYQGVFGFGLFGETDENLTAPVPDPLHPGYFYMVDRPNGSFGAIRTNHSDRTSGYNSLVLTAQQRLAHHVQFQASYTWSKTLATGEDFFGLSEPANPFISKSADRALAQEDIRNLANFNFIVDTNGVFHKAYLGPVLNNWTFSVLGTLQSGRPYPVSTGTGVFAGSTFFALGSETQQRPNVCVGGTTVTGCAGAPKGALVATNIGDSAAGNLEVGPAGVAACLSPATGLGPVVPNCAALQTTFAAPAGASSNGPLDSFAGTPVDFQYFSGNLGRNAGQSLPLYRFDTSFQKAIPIPHWETARVELKLDIFNIFNHNLFILNNANDALNFIALPSLTTTDTSGNTIVNPNFNCTSACINPFTGLYLGRNGDALTLAAFKSGRVDKNLNPNVTNFVGLGDPAGVVTPRILQLAIRFRW